MIGVPLKEALILRGSASDHNSSDKNRSSNTFLFAPFAFVASYEESKGALSVAAGVEAVLVPPKFGPEVAIVLSSHCSLSVITNQLALVTSIKEDEAG